MVLLPLEAFFPQSRVALIFGLNDLGGGLRFLFHIVNVMMVSNSRIIALSER